MSKATTTFSANDRVVHPVFGDGTIASTDADYTVIDFDTAGTRKFVTKMLSVQPSDTAAPAKPAKKKSAKKATAKTTAKAAK
ncbi:MAG TPA: hypothetical protein VF139_19595 [Candidatus Polarisedimenticolaceae bacterium]